MSARQEEINITIEALIKRKDAAGEMYDPQDIALLKQYEGNGGLKSDDGNTRGFSCEYYTPAWYAAEMWRLAYKHGYAGGTVCEPACGTGRLVANAPGDFLVTAMEPNPVAARITDLAYPYTYIHNLPFETAFLKPLPGDARDPKFGERLPNNGTWLEGAPFELVISNPPFGVWASPYAEQFPEPKLRQLEHFFIYYGLQLLRPGGLMIYLLPTNFIRNGQTYQPIKEAMGRLATLVEAYQGPPAIQSTGTPLDILILRKK